MTGWLVNDKLTCIPGTRTFWNNLLDSIPGLVDKTTQPYAVLAGVIEAECLLGEPDYIIRNAAYFPWLNVKCPVVAFVQDIMQGSARDMLLEACAASRLIVFNSEFTRAQYPELEYMTHKIIPIGTDETTFKPCEPDASIPGGAVLWVGSGHHVKGFDLACRLANESDRPWVFVMKDETEVPVKNAHVYRSIFQSELASIASACSVAVCTSRVETQHLAGIEAGMCGLPLVTTNVGAYYNRAPGVWGRVTSGDWHRDIEDVTKGDYAHPAFYWRDEGFGLSKCMDAWIETVRSLEVQHVNG